MSADHREHSGASASHRMRVADARRETATIGGYVDHTGDTIANAGSERAMHVTDVPRNTTAQQYSIARTQLLDSSSSLPYQGREEDQRVGNFPLLGDMWHIGEPIDVDEWRGLSFYIKYIPAAALATIEYVLEVNSSQSDEDDWYTVGIIESCIFKNASGIEEKYENTGETADAYPGRMAPRLMHDAHLTQVVGPRVFRLHHASEAASRTGVVGDDLPESWGPIRLVMNPFHVSPYKWARLKFREVLDNCPPDPGPGTGKIWIAHSRSV